ncbi:hypothetical protein QTI66_32615 [Variovorax sp. J22R133]|uniref:hypothetical protein n=1 Tax=Variovorax brevis TaxID=3053503 RepID=UPI00257904A1|nr:hypothetical protein [Variovorax sp. J22R133]MDM0116871.1 hypothetical protein [Variovorax sp. J22R133]
MPYTEDGLFPVLTKILKESGEPMDCNQLFDMKEVKAHAASPNRVSDYLGGLWRKGLVIRHVAAKTETSRARYTYEWKQSGKKGAAAQAKTGGIEYAPHIIADRAALMITEEGKVITITMPHCVISIRQT